MKFQIKHLGKVEGQKIKFDDPKTFMQVIKELEGEQVEVVVKKYKPYKQRTEPENNYYWGGIVTPLAEYLGYTIDEMHEILKFKFLGTKDQKTAKDGRIVTLYRAGSTASLSTIKFEEMMSKIRSWSSLEFGVYLLSPDEFNSKINYETD